MKIIYLYKYNISGVNNLDFWSIIDFLNKPKLIIKYEYLYTI